MRKFVVSMAWIAVFLAVGCGVSLALWASRAEPARSETAVHPLWVRGMELRRSDPVEIFVGYGSAMADRSATLRAEVSAVVLERVDDLEVGAFVQRGQPLIRLDDRQYRQEFDRASARVKAADAQLTQLDVQEANLGRLIEIARRELQIARNELDRVRGLLSQDQAPPRELDLARSAHEQASRVLQTYENESALLPARRQEIQAGAQADAAAAQLARLNVERCVVAAPFDGYVETLAVEMGDFVAPGAALLTLVDPSRVEVPLRLPVSARPRVQVGAPCRLDLETDDRIFWEGRIHRIDPSADPRTRTFAAYVEVDNTGEAPPLTPGMFVRGTVEGERFHEAIVAPRNAIVQGAVFLSMDGVVEKRPVLVERFLGENAVIREGLTEGDILITSNLDQLKEGQLVRVDPREGSPSSASTSLARKESPAGKPGS